MATLYVKHTGSNTSPYDTWAKAAVKITTAMAAAAAGDTIWVSNNHSESTSGNTSMSFTNSTLANPVCLVCGDDSAAPPTALATTAVVAVTGGALTGFSKSAYIYGITFNISSSGNSGGASFNDTAGHVQVYEKCTFNHLSDTGTSALTFNNSVRLISPTFKISKTTASVAASTSGCLEIIGGSWAAGGTAPTTAFTAVHQARLTVSAFDASNLGSSTNLTDATTGLSHTVVFRNCRLPSSWTGALTGGVSRMGPVDSLHNCDNGATNYILWDDQGCGSVKHETTLIKTSGASDGTTGIAWKMTSNGAVTGLRGMVLRSPEIMVWNDTTGSSKTLTVEILHDNATNLKDNEVWIDVVYLGSSSYPLGTLVSDGASFVATAADQTSSSATWTTTGMTNPNKQQLSVTFTPQLKGFVIARVVVAKPSYTLYVDPVATIS